MSASRKPFPHAYVINLKRSPERRQTMIEQLDSLGLAYTFVDGIDGRAQDYRSHPYYDRDKRLLWHGRDLLSTEIACLLSHRAVYQQALDDGHPTALLLEDDVLIQPDFPATVQAVMDLPAEWDMIRFLHDEKTRRRSRLIGPVYGEYMLTRLLSTPGGGHAYIFNQKAARRLLELSASHWQPIDVLFGYTWNTKLETFAVQPAPIYTDKKLDSLIGDTRFEKKIILTGWKRAIFPLARAGFKFYEMVCKRATTSKSWWRDRALGKLLNKQ